MPDSAQNSLVTPEVKQRLCRIYWERKAIEEGDFLLASGKRSTYYVDSRLVTTHPPALKLIGEVISRGIASIPHDGPPPLRPPLPGPYAQDELPRVVPLHVDLALCAD